MKRLFPILFLLLLTVTLGAQRQRPARVSAQPTTSRQYLANIQKEAPQLFDHFETTTDGYSARNAYLTMLASRHCYLDVVNAGTEAGYETTARDIFREWGFTRVRFPRNARTSTQCVVASNAKQVLVTFRGSEFSAPGVPLAASVDVNGWRAAVGVELPRVLVGSALKDWIGTDANLAPMSSPRWGGAKVHTGFGTALESVLDRLMAELDTPETGAAPDQGKPIYLTGHSLGGALAVLAAYRLKKAGYNIAGVYPHAAPKVGDAAFSGKYAALRIPTFRTVNFRDYIPTFPSKRIVDAYNRKVQNKAMLAGRKARASELIMAYQHPPAKLKYISSDGSLFTNPSGATVARDQGGHHRFTDHDSFLYCLKLYNAIPRSEGQGMVPPSR
ncbi:MAG: lipase family protein [Bacteroidota bacterium]